MVHAWMANTVQQLISPPCKSASSWCSTAAISWLWPTFRLARMVWSLAARICRRGIGRPMPASAAPIQRNPFLCSPPVRHRMRSIFPQTTGRRPLVVVADGGQTHLSSRCSFIGCVSPTPGPGRNPPAGSPLKQQPPAGEGSDFSLFIRRCRFGNRRSAIGAIKKPRMTPGL